MEFQEKRRCGEPTKSGQPCQQWAAVGTVDHKCIRHTKDQNRTGGGIGFQDRMPVCYCDAFTGENGKPKKHRAGVPPCKAQVSGAVRIFDTPGTGLLPTPAATDIVFEGVEGEWATYLQLIATGARLKQAATASGLTVAKVNKRRKNDPVFAEQVELAERLACDAVEDALFGLASGRYGIPNLEAIKLYLANRNPERWRGDVRNIKVEGTVEHQHEHDVTASLERIAMLEATLRDRAQYRTPARVIDTTAEEPPLRALGTPLTKESPREQGHV